MSGASPMRFPRFALILLAALAGCDDTLYHAGENREMTWDVGNSPEVVAELTRGRIDVRPGPTGKIKALFGVSIVSKTSQQVADEVVSRAPGVSSSQKDDLIEIKEKEGNGFVNCSL